MNFSAKENYGLRAVLDLAIHGGQGPVQTRELALRQHIPEQFLEQLLASLRRAEVVRSTRGASGGYSLATSADHVTVGQVLRALSGPLVPTELVNGANDSAAVVGLAETVVIRALWGNIRTALREVCDEITLQDLLNRRGLHVGEGGFMMNI